jgi:hypothetical protein
MNSLVIYKKTHLLRKNRNILTKRESRILITVIRRTEKGEPYFDHGDHEERGEGGGVVSWFSWSDDAPTGLHIVRVRVFRECNGGTSFHIYTWPSNRFP